MTLRNNTQNNDIQNYDTQNSDTQHNNAQHNGNQSIDSIFDFVVLTDVFLIAMLSVVPIMVYQYPHA